MHCGTAGQAGVPSEQLGAGPKTFIRERGQKANICSYYSKALARFLPLGIIQF